MSRRLILIGPPGVGKGTQSTLLRDRLGLVVLSSGAIFRKEVESGSELGSLAKSYMDQGLLVPDEVTIAMMREQLRGQPGGFVLDGFPRTAPQAKALDLMLQELGLGLDEAISLEVDDDVVVERLSGRLSCPNCGAVYHRLGCPPKVEGLCDRCGSALVMRSDDQPQAIRERLRVFRESTQPVIDYYRERGLLRVVDAGLPPEEVFQQIIGHVHAA